MDICSCKCEDSRNCKSQKNRKVSTKEIIFLKNQRTSRGTFIGLIDPVEIKRLNKLKKRKITEATSATKLLHAVAARNENIESEMSDSRTAESSNED